MKDKLTKFVVRNDFGSVDLNDDMREAFALIEEAAFVLQMTPAEFVSILESSPAACPCCVAEAEAEAAGQILDNFAPDCARAN